MSGSLVADLGLGPGIWLFLTFLSMLTLFFKFTRFWTIRNLDLLLLFALAPGMMRLVGSGASQPWDAYLWLFLGSALWLVRCLIDLGLSRRPLLEPNLNASGLTCVAIGMLGLLVAETINLPVEEGAARNPADPGVRAEVEDPSEATDAFEEPVAAVLRRTPLPDSLRREPPQVILARVLAGLGHLALAGMLIAIGSRHFERTILGLSAAACYLLCPYTRIALVDSGQLVPAALIVAAVLFYPRPALAGALIGLAGGWMPSCLGLIPLWIGFYRRRGGWRFAAAALGVALACGVLGHTVPVLAEWARALGARSLSQAGLLPDLSEPPHAGSFWTRIEPVYRLPVLIAYGAFVLTATWLPARKNLGELIALSAALLVASQFWYLDEGGTHLVLYLPLILLMVFRPNLNSKRAIAHEPLARQSLDHAARAST